MSDARRRAGFILTALSLAVPPAAEAGPRGIFRPQRLTAGPSNHFLGVLSPSGGRLYFVDDAEATYRIHSQDLDGGAPALLFDEQADVTWPRPSPDGRYLLYVSRQTAAAGQLCVRELGADGGVGRRRCLSGERQTVHQAEWFPDGRSIAALVRDGLGGDLHLVRYTLGGAAKSIAGVDRNLGSPSISPGGRWVAYVPVERVSSDVGADFASETARSIMLRRLERPQAEPVQVRFDLPGAGGFPVFSRDGRWLYFTQFLNDTQRDGIIDGNDNGVVFRAPFDGARALPVDVERLEQLTSAAWNCQYPWPSTERLIVSCLFEGAAQVYSLPLEGAVPATWSRDKLQEEVRASRDRWERLLLLGRRLPLEKEAQRDHTLLDMIELHLGLSEHESAEFYTNRLARSDDARARELASVLLELVQHRRAERALSRGQLSERFVADARDRLERLRTGVLASGKASASAAALARLLEGEILDTIGEQEGALTTLSAIRISEITEPFVLHFVANRAVSLYRDLGQREALLAVLGVLAGHAALSRPERLDVAEVFVRELLRGRAAKEVPALLDTWSARTDSYSDLGFRLELERRLLGLAPTSQEEVRARLFELYRKNPGAERRRALVEATIRRAAEADNDYLLYQFADTWASGVDPQSAERRVAEALYRQVVLERAYIERARGEIGDARGHFMGVTLQTDSLEAHAGFVEQRFREGHSEAQIRAEYEQRYKRHPGEPVRAFVHAWLLARRLPSEKDSALHARLAEEARAELRRAARQLAGRVELQQLWGYVEHQRWLRAHDRAAAAEAVAHYTLALDLSRELPRYRAALLESLALLQSSVGNHAIASGYFADRDRLPWTDRTAEVHHRLEKARSLFHLNRDDEAVREIDACLAMVDGTPALARFRPQVLDRAALYHLAARDFARALSLYEKLLPIVDRLPEGAERARDRYLARVGRAAAALGAGRAERALADLDAVEPMLADPRVEKDDKAREAQRLILAGLRAGAEAKLGRWSQAAAAMMRRRELLRGRFERTKLDEDRLDLALAEARLSEFAFRRGAPAEALQHVEAGLRHADAWSRSTGTPIHDLGLALLSAYAELHLDGGVPLSQYRLGLVERLEKTLAALHEKRLPAWAPMRERLGAYLAALRLEGAR